MRGMRVSVLQRSVSGLLLAGIATTAPAKIQDVNEIVVAVDGQPVTMSGKAIRTADGAILVPLRGIFEKLGAGVQYSQNTRAIIAVRGTTTVTLKVGDLTGFINGTPYSLTTPAQIVDGATLVPLRFLAQAFGAKVRFNPTTRIASVTTKDAPGTLPDTIVKEPTAPTPPPAAPGVRATIAAIDGKLTIRGTDGVMERLTLAPDPIILVKSGGNPSVRRDLEALRVGDSVTIRLDGEGRALVVEALVNGSEAPVAPVVAPLKKPAKLEITRLKAILEGRWAKASAPVEFTLLGTPGAKATLKVPGVPGLDAVEMKETASGTYSANVTLPVGIQAKDIRPSAQLALDDLASTEVTMEGALSIDTAAPKLAELTPAQGAAVADFRPQFTGVYTDAGSGIDVRKSKLVVAGKDVTADAVFTDGFFSYKPVAPLKPGKTVASLLAFDAAGNQLRKDWSFTIGSPADAEPLRSIEIAPSDKTLDYGDVLTVKVIGVPGATASFSLGDVVKDKLLREDTPGVYVGTYTIKRGDAVSGASVGVRFTPQGGPTIERIAEGGAVNAAPKPTSYTPTIDTPLDNASVGDSVTITGRALPGASVKVTLKYSGLKVVVAASGQIASLTVKADDKGSWSAGPIPLKVPRDVTRTSIIAEAVAVGSGGALSEPARIRFRK